MGEKSRAEREGRAGKGGRVIPLDEFGNPEEGALSCAPARRAGSLHTQPRRHMAIANLMSQLSPSLGTPSIVTHGHSLLPQRRTSGPTRRRTRGRRTAKTRASTTRSPAPRSQVRGLTFSPTWQQQSVHV